MCLLIETTMIVAVGAAQVCHHSSRFCSRVMGTTITDLLREAHLLMAAAAPPSLFGPFQKNCSRQLGFRQIRFSETGLPALGIPLRASSARRLLNYRITLVLSFKLVSLLCLVLL